MTALQTTIAALPSPSLPVPSVTNQQLLKSLLAGGHYRDKISAGIFATADLPALKALVAEVSPSCQPATLLEVAAVIDRLFSHYPRPDMPSHVAANRLDDWYTDLEGIPRDVLEATARDWRRSDARFAPTPGQFLEKSKRYNDPRMYVAKVAPMVISALEAADQPSPFANDGDSPAPAQRGAAA